MLGWPFRWLGYKGDPNLPPITRAITALGPAYIKFGQILSTRSDLVGEAIAADLRLTSRQRQTLIDIYESYPQDRDAETLTRIADGQL